MAASGLRLVLRANDAAAPRVISTLRWPVHLEAEARAFIRDNLLAERLGDSRRAEAALRRGVIPAEERARFLADRPSFLPEPPAALAEEIDLEDLVAEFATGLAALRTAPPGLDLAFEWL